MKAKLMTLAVLAAAFATTALAQAEQRNPLRERVQAWEAAQWAARMPGVAPPSNGMQPEVIGGHVARDGRWPFMTPLMFKPIADNVAAQICGGSLIGPRHVLTAAHCVSGPDLSRYLQVLVGTQSLLEGGHRVQVADVTVHPKYEGRDYDVAVLTLAEAVNDVEPVPFIDSIAAEARVAPEGRLVFGMGYGVMDNDTGDSSPLLLDVKVPIVSRARCNAPKSYDGKVTPRELCAGDVVDGGEDTCQGDSGGPLVARGPDRKPKVQVGVVSWGYGCAEAAYPGVYSRMATLGDWVRDQIKQ